MVSNLHQHRAIYGRLDPFAVAPFIASYGEPLSGRSYQLAYLLDRARRGRLPITADIRFELVMFLCAGNEGRRYDMALHRQKLVAMLERYASQIRKPIDR